MGSMHITCACKLSWQRVMVGGPFDDSKRCRRLVGLSSKIQLHPMDIGDLIHVYRLHVVCLATIVGGGRGPPHLVEDANHSCGGHRCTNRSHDGLDI